MRFDIRTRSVYLSAYYHSTLRYLWGWVVTLCIIVLSLYLLLCSSRGNITFDIQRCIGTVAEYYIGPGLGVLGFGARVAA